jgi:NADP-dependent 3-hydroxy acid dehydrogenase YdfG
MNSNSAIYQTDLTLPNASKSIINNCLKKFGGVDILISNAGVCFRVINFRILG